MPSPFPTLPPERRGTLHRLWHHSEVLADNPWGDPVDRDLIVHTPAGHDGRDLPAILLLPGFAGTGEGLLGRGLGDVPISTRIDQLVADGCPPFVAVLPDVMTRVGGSQFLDSPGIGAYQSYLVDEIMPHVDQTFGTSGRWAVAGRSSGGFGAFHLALRAPERVRAIAFHAGDAGFDLCYLGDLPKAIRGVRKLGGVDGFHDAFWAQHRPGGDAFAAFNLIGMACAYSPAPTASPLPARLPFDAEEGTVDLEVFRSWSRFDPVELAQDPAVCRTLAGLELCFVDAGRWDEYSLQLGARRLVKHLRAGGVDVVHEEFDGGHRGTAWRYDVSLPRLASALTA